MKIGELSIKTGCPVETIRYYERQSLLPEPDRTSGNYRDYSPVHLERLQFIRNCRSLDMSHQEIKTLLSFQDNPLGDCSCVNDLVEEHLDHVNQRINELKKLKNQLARLRERCPKVAGLDECGILKDLSSKNRKISEENNHLASGKEMHH